MKDAKVTFQIALSPAQITALREEMGVTRRKFAALVGVHPKSVRGWENGVRPHASAMKVLIQAAALFDTSHRMKGQK